MVINTNDNTKYSYHTLMKKSIFILIALTILGSLASCSNNTNDNNSNNNNKSNEKEANPAIYLSTEEQKASINSLKDIDNGRFYVMDYTADYKLDELVNANLTDVQSMIDFIQKKLLNGGETSANAQNIGCSAFTASSRDGKKLYGRNFDYKMDMSAVLIRTTPKDGYKSIGLADAGWVGYGLGSLNDKKTDLSMAVSFPYLIMDGMNEKGLAVSVLLLRGTPTRQDTGKNKIGTTVAMRLMLDKAKDVDEAIDLISKFDMQSSMPDANFHFLLSDATGKTVVLEYAINKMNVIDANFVANHYLSPSMNGEGHGKERYEVLKAALNFRNNELTETESMSLLEMVSQWETEEATSMTQWSVVYNLTDLSAEVAIRRNYRKLFKFTLDNISGDL